MHCRKVTDKPFNKANEDDDDFIVFKHCSSLYTISTEVTVIYYRIHMGLF